MNFVVYPMFMYLITALSAVQRQNDSPSYLFYETIDTLSKWIPSSNLGGEWKVGQVDGAPYLGNDHSLILKNPADQHVISRVLDRPISGVDEGQSLVVQFEVRFPSNFQCGEASLKLFAYNETFSSEDANDSSPYVLAFGPANCRAAPDQVHFSFRHKSPKTGEWEKKSLEDPPKPKTNNRTHLYTLFIGGDNSFAIFIDKVQVKTGSLLADFRPPVNPPEEIDDPNDKKPHDWVDQDKIPDPNALPPKVCEDDAHHIEIPYPPADLHKPEPDCEEPEYYIDPHAVKPSTWCVDCPDQIHDKQAQRPVDWDEVVNGEWEPPLIANPQCDLGGCGVWGTRNPEFRGKWKAPIIHNPAYQGKWKPHRIHNPNYFQDLKPYKLSPIGAIGFVVQTNGENIEFDNIYIGNLLDAAWDMADKTWAPKRDLEKKLNPGPDDDDYFGACCDWLHANCLCPLWQLTYYPFVRCVLALIFLWKGLLLMFYNYYVSQVAWIIKKCLQLLLLLFITVSVLFGNSLINSTPEKIEQETEQELIISRRLKTQKPKPTKKPRHRKKAKTPTPKTPKSKPKTPTSKPKKMN